MRKSFVEKIDQKSLFPTIPKAETMHPLFWKVFDVVTFLLWFHKSIAKYFPAKYLQSIAFAALKGLVLMELIKYPVQNSMDIIIFMI